MPRYYPWFAYVPLLELLLCCFNAILFLLLSFLCLRDFRGRRTQWGGYLFPAILVVFALLFLVHLATLIVIGLFGRRLLFLDTPEVAANYLIPPLVAHLFYRSEKESLTASRVWKISLVAWYLVSFLSGAAAVNAVTGTWRQGWPTWPVIIVLFRVLMVGAATWCGLLLWASRRSNRSALEASQRRWLLILCGVWMSVFLFEGLLPGEWGSILEKFLPLGFLFVVTYYVERSTLVDVLIKQGAFVFTSLLLLTLYFVFVPPLLTRLHFLTWAGSLVWALSIWPIVVLAPWGHRKLAAWLDRIWLGRRFSPAEATKYFLSGLQGVISENELARKAEDHLVAIFGSEVEVLLVAPPPPADPARNFMIAPIRLAGESVGEIRIGPRPHHVRFLSQDMTLLASLTDGLAFLLENLRLREKRLEQEQREQELRFNASRAELKALRAQVNPHFLFNALNTIAGLIPRRPERAEETIEELAEVFRHTLRRSEREWVGLDEELEALRAYLHIEEARFGEGQFRFQIECDSDPAEIRIPSMIIATLVENAVKHGVGSLTDSATGIVDVRVHASQSRLRIEVRDNGPGFQKSAARNKRGEGYGLRNVADRLKGYFGDEVSLIIGRDEACNMTLVSIDMPRKARTAEVAP